MTQFLLIFTMWAVGHSLLAAAVLKRWVAARLGEEATAAFYRLTYSLISLLTFVPVVWAWWQLPTAVVWQVSGVGRWLVWGVGGAAIAAAGYSLLKTNALSFAGLTPALDYLAGRPSRTVDGPQLSSDLVVTGLYAWMRHPLYTFSMVFLWANPTMTVPSLLMAAACTAYFIIGSIYEERRLVAQFGAAYVAYQQRVPRFLPRPWRTTKPR